MYLCEKLLGNQLHLQNKSIWATIISNNCTKCYGHGNPTLVYIVCSFDRGSNHKQIALETCLKLIFAIMPTMRPNAIVIDRYWTQYNVISYVIAQHPHS